MSNTRRGNYVTTEAAIWRAFDKLPKEVRERLTECNLDFVPQPVLTYYRKYRGWTSDAIAATIQLLEDWDEYDKREHFYRLDRMQRTGVDYLVPVRMGRAKKTG